MHTFLTVLRVRSKNWRAAFSSLSFFSVFVAVSLPDAELPVTVLRKIGAPRVQNTSTAVERVGVNTRLELPKDYTPYH